MGIITAFVILAIDVLLWLLPIQGAIESFRTNEITNVFTVAASVSGNATATLSEELFNADTDLITSISTNNTAVTPSVGGYNDTTKVLTVESLVPSSTVILTVSYFVDAFPNQAVWSSAINLAPYFYILVLVILPVLAVALFVMELRKRGSHA